MEKVSLINIKARFAIGIMLCGLMFCCLFSCQSGEAKRPTTVNFNNLSTKASVTVQDSSDPVGRVDVSVMVDSIERRFYYHFSESFTKKDKTPLPVVFVYHDQRTNASGFYRTSGWKEKSEAEGFLVVFPEAFSGKKPEEANKFSWNNGEEELTLQSPVDDVAFFREMVSALDSLRSIDRNRIFATGLGSGGGMVSRLALEAPEILAAIGTVSGLNYSTTSEPGSENVVSCLSIQGVEDPLLLWKWPNPKPNAKAIMNSSVGDIIKSYTQAFGFNEDFEAKSDHPGQYAVGFQHENQRSSYIFLLVNNLKYGYPGALDISPERHGTAATSLNAIDLFWTFFEAHARGREVVQ